MSNTGRENDSVKSNQFQETLKDLKDMFRDADTMATLIKLHSTQSIADLNGVLFDITVEMHNGLIHYGPSFVSEEDFTLVSKLSELVSEELKSRSPIDAVK